MSASTDRKAETKIIETARAHEVAISDNHAHTIARYLELLLKWNRTIRLTGATTVDELIDRHLCDTFALFNAIRPNRALETVCLDVGSGNGLPGIPLAIIWPESAITFVDSNRRKCAFLRTAASTLGLKGVVDERRIEQCTELKEHFDLAWSKATFSPTAWIDTGLPFVKPGGFIAAFLAHHRDPVQLTGDNALLRQTLDYRSSDGVCRQLAILAKKG